MQEHLPPAIRDDSSPSAIFGFVPGYTIVLIFLRWTSYKCPHCGAVFRRDYGTPNVCLGNAERSGKTCGKFFDGGSHGCSQFAWGQKLPLILQPLILAIWRGLAIAAIWSVFVGPRNEHSWPEVCFGPIPALVRSPVGQQRVIRSVRRYNDGHRTH